MSGFFSKKETESISAVGGKIHSCASCGLYRDCRSPKMKPYGNFEKGIMCIGDHPSKTDDAKGIPWQGSDGKLLQQTFNQMGIDLFGDCINLNAINCMTPNSRRESPAEINHCRSVLVWKAIKEYQPKVILLFGEAAVASVIGYQWSGGGGFSKWRGFCIPDQDLKAWVCPVFHPKDILRSDKARDMLTLWKNDLNDALEKAEQPFPRFRQPNIHIEKDLRFLKENKASLCAFDYETTGLKPQAKGHRIVCASIATSENDVYAFLMPKTKKGRLPFRKWLYNRQVSKMAHNIKFEDTWGSQILKVRTRGWEWDSMLAAHVLDNRPGITGLKFQMYAQFGAADWSTEVDSYLKSDNKQGGNTLNSVQKLLKTKKGTEDLLTYCALDSVYEYRLAVKQMEMLNHDFLPF